MHRPLTRQLLLELKAQGYAAVVAAGQLDADEAVFRATKDLDDTIVDCASCRPFEEDEIILLVGHVIDFIPDRYYEGKTLEDDTGLSLQSE